MRSSAQRIEMRCILFCDIVRSTPQFVQARQTGGENSYRESIQRFVEIWRDILADHGASYIKPLGDGLLATSADAVGMLRAALRAQDAISKDTPCASLSVRVGLHIGTVSVQSDGDILGADAALGERVMAEARAGQVFVSEACASQLRPYLPAGCSLRSVGERILKGFDLPVPLYQLLVAGSPEAAVQPPVVPAPISSAPIRLLLVDDEYLLRNALASLLKLEPDFELVGQAANGAMAVSEALSKRPDVALMDIEMPVMNGIEATRRIRESCPDTEICILTKFGDDEKVFAALRAGAIGYMLKDAGVDEIGPVVRAVYRKEGFLSPALVPRVIQEFTRLSKTRSETRALFAELTRREMEVLELLGQGMRNRIIAERLFISEKTAKNHISNILDKLQVNDRTEAALLARQSGLVPA